MTTPVHDDAGVAIGSFGIHAEDPHNPLWWDLGVGTVNHRFLVSVGDKAYPSGSMRSVSHARALGVV